MTRKSRFEDGPVAAIVTMSGLGVWWALAGGWAIDLWLGERTREHHDVEVAVRRVDRTALWDGLQGGHELACIDPPGSGWRPWHREGAVSQPAFQIQVRRPGVMFDVFLEDTVGAEWVFRRDARIRRPLVEVTAESSGAPVLRPEVQLLYMAKSDDPKNEYDFEAVLPRLDPPSRAWLAVSLGVMHPKHRWLSRLASS